MLREGREARGAGEAPLSPARIENWPNFPSLSSFPQHHSRHTGGHWVQAYLVQTCPAFDGAGGWERSASKGPQEDAEDSLCLSMPFRIWYLHP